MSHPCTVWLSGQRKEEEDDNEEDDSEYSPSHQHPTNKRSKSAHNKRVNYYKQQSRKEIINNNNNNQDESKSRSQSRSKLRSKSNGRRRSNIFQSPSYQQNYHSTPSYNQSNINYHQHESTKPLSIPNPNYMSPFSMAHPPPHLRNRKPKIKAIKKKNSLIQQPIKPTPIKPTENDDKNNKKSMIEKFVDGFKDIMYYILWVPMKIYELVRFFLSHWMMCFIIIILSIFLYSPAMKLIESYNISNTSIRDILEKIGIIPGIKYCNSDGDIDNDCVQCPQYANCIGGDVHCIGDRVFIDGKCSYPPKITNALRYEMEIFTQNLLSVKLGKYECQSYCLYKYFYDDTIENKTLSHQMLQRELSKKLQILPNSHMFTKIFDEFTDDIKFSDLIHWSLRYDANVNGYYSTKSSKPLLCHLNILLYYYWHIIFPLIFILFLIGKWRYNINKIQKKQLKQKQIKDDVIGVLNDYYQNNNNKEKWLPIAQLKNQIIGQNDNEWKIIEKLVDRDPNVTKSARMIDGVQKLCWKLSDTALIN